ncbi:MULTISPECIES: hypothetical protein [unclassified Streptomyces]|uniref:hypothetical protein n=1 Tax=unclassified Streptomyces TaxID=2593676 RepID=UPI00236580CB|nr:MULTISPECIES: hypothetical protein [unclassified Streptomyces]MDF3147084.1 hypothetical protein [Streptomyces sp. T21Q-yed]WDF43527.1 hypothetical protein PBV52_45505 [Streptomyces sp. T12]
MGADKESTPQARRAALPDHRNVNTPWWQELWGRHAHITTPLRERGLECDIEYGLSSYIVRVSLPDDSFLIIGPPQEPASDRPPGNPEGWIATREDPDDPSLFEVVYDSAPSADPRAPQRPEARHGGNATPLIEAIDHRLAQLGLLPHPVSPTGIPHAQQADAAGRAPDVPDTADRASVYVCGKAMLALTDRLNGAESHADAAALLHQVLDPVNGLLERLGEFFEAAGEKAKEAEEDDGFDLSYDLADAAAEIRNLAEVLHVAEDRMRALTPPLPTPRLPSAPARPPSPPSRALPPAPPRHRR